MMSNYKTKVNNSYESSSSGSASSNSVGDTNAHISINFDLNEGHRLSNILLPTTVTKGMEYEIYNTSAEEGIFPNIIPNSTIAAPSYDPEYDYYNQYSTTPLVYSWMPIVPGFSQDGSHNLHNFEHIIKRHPQPLNISNIEDESSVISDQNIKYETSLVLNNSDPTFYILNNSNGMTFHQLEDSCNAMDLNISCSEHCKNTNLELSFNGKIPELTTPLITSLNEIEDLINVEEENHDIVHPDQFSIIKTEDLNEECTTKQDDNNENIKELEEKEDEEESSGENERLRNESFELLKQEDSTKMIFLNEKSPDVPENCDLQDEITDGQLVQQQQQQKTDLITPEQIEETKENESDEILTAKYEPKTLKQCDDFIVKKLQTSLSELCPPPSIATLPLSLSEMLAIYRKNSEISSESFTKISNSHMFIPSHPANETLEAEWPKVLEIKAPGISYNRSTDCEEIEVMCLRYAERFIKAETSSSYNHRVGPASAKKRTEKLKLLTQSPGSRLSHLANRRKVFSSANLKSTSSTASHNNKTFCGSMLIDKTKLYQKRKRLSAKKKTPGKKKTPKSAKRQMQIAKPPSSTTVATSKRALFTSPAQNSKSNKNDDSAKTSRNILNRGILPKRSLFSPAQKRKRSPSPDAENRFGKNRRLESPSRLIIKSKSFSIAAPSTSSGSLDEHFRKTLFYRTQSEMVLNQSIESNKNNLGFRKPMSETDKKKLLWTASSVLQAKQINRNHEKFKDYMSTLCKLVKRIFTEFYNPSKSMSAQMTKFSNLMVFYVIQGRPVEEIYMIAKNRLEAQNPCKVTGYVPQENYEKNNFISNSSSTLLMSSSCSSLNLTDNSESFIDNISDKSLSDVSLNRSTSKNNENGVLCENLLTRGNSIKKQTFFGGSDTNVSQLKTSTPSSNVLKAKRQISF